MSEYNNHTLTTESVMYNTTDNNTLGVERDQYPHFLVEMSDGEVDVFNSFKFKECRNSTYTGVSIIAAISIISTIALSYLIGYRTTDYYKIKTILSKVKDDEKSYINYAELLNIKQDFYTAEQISKRGFIRYLASKIKDSFVKCLSYCFRRTKYTELKNFS